MTSFAPQPGPVTPASELASAKSDVSSDTSPTSQGGNDDEPTFVSV